MPAYVTVRDETAGGTPLGETQILFPATHLTVRELIQTRIAQEILDYNFQQPDYFRGLVQPAGAELSAQGAKLAIARKLDWHAFARVALEAFGRRELLVLINDQQAEALEDPVHLTPETQLTFVCLHPLVAEG